MNKTTSEVLVSAFKAKLAQATPLIERPTLLLKNKWDNPNFKMFLLDVEFSRPTALLLLPTGKVVLVAHAMEVAAVEPLKNELELIAYQKADEYLGGITEFIHKGSAIEIEQSNSIAGLDLISHSTHKQFKKLYDLNSAEGVLLQLRSQKNPRELSFISEAIQNTQVILAEVEKMVKPGTTEVEINRLIHHMAVDLDMGLSFSPIIAAGPRGTDPHPVRYTKRALEKGDRLIVDLGLWCHGYASDITRTYLVGGKLTDLPWYAVDRKIIKKLTTMDLSEQTSVSLGKELQQVVADAGMLGLEKHSYGHGLGVEVHDIHPLIAAVEHPLGNLKLTDGCVFTMEPGFYDESGGFRIEDDYVIKDGHALMIK